MVKLFLGRLKKKKKQGNCHTSHCYSQACLGSYSGSCQRPDISEERGSRAKVGGFCICRALSKSLLQALENGVMVVEFGYMIVW
jgi:hypothetical protein